jgi:hypothetical protein
VTVFRASFLTERDGLHGVESRKKILRAGIEGAGDENETAESVT